MSTVADEVKLVGEVAIAAAKKEAENTQGMSRVEDLLSRGDLDGARAVLAKINERSSADCLVAKEQAKTILVLQDVAYFRNQQGTTGWEDMVPQLSSWLSQSVVFPDLNPRVTHVMLSSFPSSGEMVFAKLVAKQFNTTLYQSLKSAKLGSNVEAGEYRNTAINGSSMCVDFSALKRSSTEEIRQVITRQFDCAQRTAYWLSINDSWYSVVILKNVDSLFSNENDIGPLTDINADEQTLNGVSTGATSQVLTSKVTKQAATPEAKLALSWNQSVKNRQGETQATSDAATGVRTVAVESAATKQDNKINIQTETTTATPSSRIPLRPAATPFLRNVIDAVSATASNAVNILLSLGGGGRTSRVAGNSAALISMLEEIFAPASIEARWPNLKFLWTSHVPWALPEQIRKIMDLNYFLGLPNSAFRETIVHKQIGGNLFKINRLLGTTKESGELITKFAGRIAELTGPTHKAKCRLEIQHCMTKQDIVDIVKKLHLDEFRHSSRTHIWGATVQEVATIVQKCFTYKLNQILTKLVDQNQISIDHPSGKYKCKLPGGCGKAATVTTPEAAYDIMFPATDPQNLKNLLEWDSDEDKEKLIQIVLETTSIQQSLKDRDYPLLLGWAFTGGDMHKFNSWKSANCPKSNLKCDDLFTHRSSDPTGIPLKPAVSHLPTYPQNYAEFQAKADSGNPSASGPRTWVDPALLDNKKDDGLTEYTEEYGPPRRRSSRKSGPKFPRKMIFADVGGGHATSSLKPRFSKRKTLTPRVKK